MKVIAGIIVGVVVLLGGGVGFWYWQDHNHTSTSFRTVPVERADVWATISATGTVQPEEQVVVGAQVVGQVKSLGRDPRNSARFVDFCTVVEEGTILAKLDDTLYKTRVDQAKANLKRAEAELEQARTRLVQTEREWERVRRLGPQGAVSGLEYDTAHANYESAKAAPAMAAATVDQMKAALEEAEKTLGYTTIRSPVNGTIIERMVNVGQTVVSSFNAPSLFVIATDLTKMQVWAAVNEADIGSIHVGQEVRFTVDSRPTEVFTGKVFQIRLNATMMQNVVIYTVVVNTDNSHGKLLPKQTANLLFDVSRHSNVLAVPNSALRWKPQLSMVAPDMREDYARSLRRKAAVTMGRTGENTDERQSAYVWVQDGAFARPLKVRTGISDGMVTEIVSGDLGEGDQVIVGEHGQNGSDQTVNPFTPQFGNRKQQ